MGPTATFVRRKTDTAIGAKKFSISFILFQMTVQYPTNVQWQYQVPPSCSSSRNGKLPGRESSKHLSKFSNRKPGNLNVEQYWLSFESSKEKYYCCWNKRPMLTKHKCISDTSTIVDDKIPREMMSCLLIATKRNDTSAKNTRWQFFQSTTTSQKRCSTGCTTSLRGQLIIVINPFKALLNGPSAYNNRWICNYSILSSGFRFPVSLRPLTRLLTQTYYANGLMINTFFM